MWCAETTICYVFISVIIIWNCLWWTFIFPIFIFGINGLVGLDSSSEMCITFLIIWNNSPCQPSSYILILFVRGKNASISILVIVLVFSSKAIKMSAVVFTSKQDVM